MDDKTAKELLKYIAENNWKESKFLSMKPATTVEIVGLLDKIAELRSIDPVENRKQFNEIVDSLEK